jgi:hypothetical protein
MKTAATRHRPLLLILGAVVVAAVALNAQTRSGAPVTAAIEPAAPQTVAIAEAPAVATPVPQAAAPAEFAPGEAGMRVYLDPEGGLTHVAPASEVQPLAALPVRPERLPEVTLPDGSVMVDLQGQFEEFTVMSIDANGQKVVTCVQHPGVVHRHAAAPVEREEK